MPLLKPVRLPALVFPLVLSLAIAVWPGARTIHAETYAGNHPAAAIISAPDVRVAVKAGAVTIVDVRSPREWRQTGVAAGARTVTIHNRKGIKAFIAEMEDAVGGDKSTPLALICATGVRSARAAKILTAAGFTNLQNVSEGMLGRPDAGPGWLKRGLPLTQADPLPKQSGVIR